MPGILVNDAEGDILAYAVNKAASENIVLRLFQNDRRPTADDKISDYVESNFSGYSPIVLDGAKWEITTGPLADAVYQKQVFVSDRGEQSQLIYGYYMTRAGSNKLVAVERFADGPYKIRNNEDEIRIVPHIILGKARAI